MFIKYLFLELVKLLTGRVHRLVELHNLRLVFFSVWIFIVLLLGHKSYFWDILCYMVVFGAVSMRHCFLSGF